jgi:hypothetical protein
MLLACSHVLLASDDVPRITRFFERAFDLRPRFENDMFSEFVLPSRFCLAFLLTDPDGNRWEITQTPTSDGMLTDR